MEGFGASEMALVDAAEVFLERCGVPHEVLQVEHVVLGILPQLRQHAVEHAED